MFPCRRAFSVASHACVGLDKRDMYHACFWHGLRSGWLMLLCSRYSQGGLERTETALQGRAEAIADFCRGGDDGAAEQPVLVCTDLAAR